MNPQARLGAFVLTALILLAFATSRIGDIVWPRQESHIVETEFDDLLGLEVQSPVRMAGVKVGLVQEILLRNNRALVRLALKPDLKLPASVRASIIGRGLVGEKNLILKAAAGDTELLAEGAIIPSDPTGDLNTFMAKASDISDDIKSLTHALSSGISGDNGLGAIQDLIAKGNRTVAELTALIRENRNSLRDSTASMQRIIQTVEKELPAILQQMRQASGEINRLMRNHRKDLAAFASDLPELSGSGKKFFSEGKAAAENLNAMILDNRENLFRTLFELRKASESFEAFADDIRRNPWKLMKKKPEIKADRRARQQKMEEMLMTTGRMGIAPARK
jgi:virulence factor Mce-like protein